MAKIKTIFTCQECGAQRPRWEGQCKDCGAWNSFVEEKQISAPKNARGWSVQSAEPQALTRTHLGEVSSEDKNSEKVSAQNRNPRFPTGISELDRVLGGGLVTGSYILLGGDPGIGKSTLLLQMAGGLAESNKKVLYVSGEESVGQTVLRAHRLGIKNSLIHVASESRLENILELARSENPTALIVDSIQTVYLQDLTSAPGTVSQVRECASRLMALAKSHGIAVFLVGHITKDGNIAGPKTLEHMVDTVLSFEGDPSQQFRLLRAQKNRFGATNELGVFQMESEGLIEVENPSEMFLAERGEDSIGSAIFVAMEGTRPLLCEVQSLSSSTFLSMPRRTSIGFDVNRVHLLAAVMDKHLDTDFARNDIFVNVVGGLKLTEPAADLAVASAMISTLSSQELNRDTAFLGEIGLTGEVRTVSHIIERVREAEKLGFKNIILPMSNKKTFDKFTNQKKNKYQIQFSYVRNIKELSSMIMGSRYVKRDSEQSGKEDFL